MHARVSYPSTLATHCHTGSTRSNGGRRVVALPALPRLAATKKHCVMVPRATAVVGSETPAVQESEKYGIFKLDYDVKNVRRGCLVGGSQITSRYLLIRRTPI